MLVSLRTRRCPRCKPGPGRLYRRVDEADRPPLPTSVPLPRPGSRRSPRNAGGALALLHGSSVCLSYLP